MNHEHCCKHENLKYCQVCKLVYCKGCNKEWRDWGWTYTNPWIHTSPTINPSHTGTITPGSTVTAYNTGACKHE